MWRNIGYKMIKKNNIIFMLLYLCAAAYYGWWNFSQESIATMKKQFASTHRADLKQHLLTYQFTLRGGNLEKQQNYGDKDVLEQTFGPKICNKETVQELIQPCKQFIAWDKRQKNNSQQRTYTKNSLITVDIYKSVLTNLHIGKLDIVTYDRRGMKKKVGGDSWRSIVISKEQNSSVEIRDSSDGSYQGWFLLLYPGKFTLKVALEYSLCEGITDPPLNWFMKGNVQGKFQKDGILGKIDHFLNEQFQPITFNITFNNQPTIEELERLHREINVFLHKPNNSHVFNSACGFWRNKKYYSYLDSTASEKVLKSIPKSIDKPLDVLWIYGDSLNRRFYYSLKAHKLCHTIFKRCNLTYVWNYKEFKGGYGKGGADFNESRLVNDVKQDIIRTELMTPKSVFLINVGLHVIMSLQMERCFSLFRSILKMVHELRKQYGMEKLPLIIWKTTTPPVLENSPLFNITYTRFLTKQRVRIWNSYTIKKTQEANIPVLDVHDLPLAALFGYFDHVHFKYETFHKAEDELMYYILNKNKLL